MKFCAFAELSNVLLNERKSTHTLCLMFSRFLRYIKLVNIKKSFQNFSPAVLSDKSLQSNSTEVKFYRC